MNTLSIIPLIALLLLPLLFLFALSNGNGGREPTRFLPRRLRPRSPLHRCSRVVAGLLFLTPFAQALDVQPLPSETWARTGFNYAARVTWDDLNASDNASTTLQLYPISTNSYISRVAFYVEENFTNSTASATNLLLCIGVGGSTNFFFTTNQVDGSDTMVLSGLNVSGLMTNTLVPYKSTTSTNYLIATLSAGGSTVDTYTRGKLVIYFNVWRPAIIKF